jgi:hypothetical protein
MIDAQAAESRSRMATYLLQEDRNGSAARASAPRENIRRPYRLPEPRRVRRVASYAIAFGQEQGNGRV